MNDGLALYLSCGPSHHRANLILLVEAKSSKALYIALKCSRRQKKLLCITSIVTTARKGSFNYQQVQFDQMLSQY